MIKPPSYVLIVVLAFVAAFGYRVRVQGLFACPASGYGDEGYLAYCHGSTFGDYDHGAFWFGLEPEVRAAAAAADVLFLGSSRMQFAFSSEATDSWFATRRLRHYLLGFGYTENVTFVAPLLEELKPRAAAYVINVDRFFVTDETRPAAEIFASEKTARLKYEEKQRWQGPHQMLCESLPAVCGDEVAFFRSRSTGRWRLGGHSQGGASLTPAPVADGPSDDPRQVDTYARAAHDFVADLPVAANCVILTLVPYKDTRRAEAEAIASALEMDLVTPDAGPLRTFDGSHLDVESAERWSAAFFAAVGPRLKACAAGEFAAR